MALRSSPAALQLHFDVSAGVRADALVGALLGVGAPRAAADEALAVLLGGGAVLNVDSRRALGVLAQRAHIGWPGADAGATDASEAATRAGGDRRRRSRTYVRDQRRKRAITPAAEAAAPSPDAAEPTAPARRDKGARAPLEPDLLARLAAGERARPAELIVAVRTSALPPVTKALALRTCTALVEGLGRVRGAVDEPVLEGSFALRALAHVAATCALVDALAPTVVSASVIGVSSRATLSEGLDPESRLAPSSWLLSVLEGAWLVEREDVAASDIVGAALVRTLAARFGARALFSPHRQGFGVSSVADTTAPLLVRASTGRAAPVGTRAGEARGAPCASVRAALDVSADREALQRALFEAGALDVTVRDARRLRGEAVLGVDVWGAPGSVDAVVRALWRAGADRVSTSWIEVRSPGVEDVTVPVGRGRTKGAVRVRVARDEGGDLLSVRCVAEDVREVARATGRPEEVVRAEATQQFYALVEVGGQVGRSEAAPGDVAEHGETDEDEDDDE